MAKEFMVWYAPGVHERFEAEDIRACSKKVRETRPNEPTYFIAPFEDWKKLKAIGSLGRNQRTEDKVRRYAHERKYTEAELNAELQRIDSMSGRSSISASSAI